MVKGIVRILDNGPHFQVSQCVIYHWRDRLPFNSFKGTENTPHPPAKLFAGLDLTDPPDSPLCSWDYYDFTQLGGILTLSFNIDFD